MAVWCGARATAHGGRSRGRHAVGRRARRLGDLRRGGPLGGQHQQLELARSTRSARPRTTTTPDGRGDPGLPPLQVGRGRTSAAASRRSTSRARARAPTRNAGRQRLQARPRLLRGRAGPQGPGARCSSSSRRRTTSRPSSLLIGANNYGFADIVAGVRHQLADVAVVVEELLPRRLGHHARASPRRAIATETANIKGAILNVAPGDDERRLRRRRSTRSSCRPTRRRSRAAPASATRRPAARGRPIGGCGVWNRDADWANDTVVPRDQQHGAQRGRRRPGCANIEGPRHAATRSTGAGCARTRVGLLEEKGVANWQSRRRGRQDRVGQPDPHGHDDLRPVPAPGGRAPELLGPARAAQLPAPGLQRRRRRAAGPARSAAPGSTASASR